MIRAALPFSVVVLVSAILAQAQAISIRPGRYETTAEIPMPGGKAPMKTTGFDCITPEEGRDLLQAMLKQAATDGSCTLSNVTRAGNKVTFDTVCKVDGIVNTARTEMTVGADSFTFTATMNIDGKAAVTRASAKWVAAACKPEDN